MIPYKTKLLLKRFKLFEVKFLNVITRNILCLLMAQQKKIMEYRTNNSDIVNQSMQKLSFHVVDFTYIVIVVEFLVNNLTENERKILTRIILGVGMF